MASSLNFDQLSLLYENECPVHQNTRSVCDDNNETKCGDRFGEATSPLIQQDEGETNEAGEAKFILKNFIIFSILFSANHGAVVSCLSLASARLGNLGSIQNSVLYLSYTFSALFGSTYVIKTIGSYYSIIVGMVVYCLYVLSYVIATATTCTTTPCASDSSSLQNLRNVAIIAGGFIGGIGGGFLWTAQGSYFASASQLYSRKTVTTSSLTVSPPETSTPLIIDIDTVIEKERRLYEESTSLFAGIFAFIYLMIEVMMRLFSTFIIEVFDWSWKSVFSGYGLIAVLSTILMISIVHDVEVHCDHEEVISQQNTRNQQEHDDNDENANLLLESRYHKVAAGSGTPSFPVMTDRVEEKYNESVFYRATITFRMLLQDPKMKYVFPISSVFGLSSVFIVAFVNGEVLRISLNDDKSVYIGILSSITSATAGIMSIVFGFLSQRIGNAIILIIGCLSFMMIAVLFIVIHDLKQITLGSLMIVYILQGVGRSTFEGTLKAEFALLFEEKEGAFGNIIFQNGLVTTIGFYLVSHLYCTSESIHCIKYADGLLHNIFVFELLIIMCAIIAIAGYMRAKWIHTKELEQAKSTRNESPGGGPNEENTVV